MRHFFVVSSVYAVTSALFACTEAPPAALVEAPLQFSQPRLAEVLAFNYDAESNKLEVIAQLPVGLTTAAPKVDLVLSAQVGFASDLTDVSLSAGHALLLRDAAPATVVEPGKAGVSFAVALPNIPNPELGFTVDVRVPGLAKTGPSCPNGCNGHGFCVPGGCVCVAGYEGPTCGTASTCPNLCSGNGICFAGSCQCLDGFSGDDCSIDEGSGSGCKSGCVNGICSAGVCYCAQGYSGPDCSVPVGCPNNCSNNGACQNGTCNCAEGFAGEDCSISTTLPCPKDCSNNGVCFQGTCFCNPGWTGEACSSQSN